MSDQASAGELVKTNKLIERLLGKYDDNKHSLKIFMNGVLQTIGDHPDLATNDHKIVHSCKSRLKENSHLQGKILRKLESGCNINSENLFYEITDLAGVRILHLFQDDFGQIDEVIRGKVAEGDWILAEKPKAFTWDPEAHSYFKKFDLDVSKKETLYTSVHYLVRPREDSPICCEIQVRTLFEEIWAEVDHQINYPTKTDNLACREQIMVLSKIVGAGSRLLDSLRRVNDS